MRLIDADELWKEFCRSEAIEERYGSGVLEIVGDIIDNAPTIDDMPVYMSISSYTIDYLEKISKQLERIIELQKYQLKGWVDRKYE